MLNIIYRKQSANKGFTLIELLVVIAIIGVLASIVLASLNSARRKSRDARRIVDIKQIQLALELYFDGQGSQYPAASITCDTSTAYGLETLVTNGYIPQVPRDPSASPNCYKYAAASTGARTTYHIGTSLEDTSNPALSADKDCRSDGTAPLCVTGLTYTNGFDGTVATLYDVTP